MQPAEENYSEFSRCLQNVNGNHFICDAGLTDQPNHVFEIKPQLVEYVLCVLSVRVVGMEELQVIKKELTLIKTQIDGLLDSLDRMDTQRSDHKGEALIYADSEIRTEQDCLMSHQGCSFGISRFSDSRLISSTIQIRKTQNRSCTRLQTEDVLCH